MSWLGDAWDWASDAAGDAYDWTKDALDDVGGILDDAGDLWGEIGDIFGGSDSHEGKVWTEDWWIRGDQSSGATAVARVPGFVWIGAVLVVGFVLVKR